MRTITLCYKKVIDASSKESWEKMVFEDSYAELKMQTQFFNTEKKYQTLAQILQNNAEAQRLHFLVSPSVVGYLKQMNGVIPDVFNNIGKYFLKFLNFQFEIINSHLLDISKHKVAIDFYSQPLTWLDTVSDLLLVSDQNARDMEFQTQMFRLQPYLTIQTLKID